MVPPRFSEFKITIFVFWASHHQKSFMKIPGILNPGPGQSGINLSSKNYPASSIHYPVSQHPVSGNQYPASSKTSTKSESAAKKRERSNDYFEEGKILQEKWNYKN